MPESTPREDTPTSTVGLLADPGVPRQIAESIGSRLSIDLQDEVGGRWLVEVSEESLPIAPSGAIPLAECTPELLSRHRWVRVVYLTDLTQYRGDTPIRYLLADDDSSVVVFVPAIGPTRPAASVRRLVRDILVADHRDSPLPDSRVRGLLGRLRMLAGMVRSNRPAAMGRALRGCTAVGMASGAFGIFFGSVWPIADSMSCLRLATVSISVVSALSAWLIVRNGLWTRGRNPAPQSGTLDNASTVATVWTAVALMHVVLFIGLAALAGIVVEPSYLAGQLGHATSVRDYLVLGWFSASMGTMAGALGSNFDDETIVREATYSRRWHQRRLMFDDYGS